MLSLMTAAIWAALFCSGGSAQTAAPAAERPAARPLRYGFVVDNSGSLRMQLELIANLVKDVAAENGANDQAFVVRFISSDKVKLVQDFTADKELIGDAADGMYIEGGQTAMLDAVSMAADHLEKGSDASSSRALLVITDGDERDSAARIDEVLIKLKKAGIRVFAIGVSDLKVETRVLDKLTRGTGGKLVLYKRREAAVNAAKEVAAAMRAN